MPPEPRGTPDRQLADLREWLQIMVRQLNDSDFETQATVDTAEKENAPTSDNTRKMSTFSESGSVACPNRTGIAAGSINLKRGVYILECSAVFPQNATGSRIVNCSTAEGSVARIPHCSVAMSAFDNSIPVNVVQVVNLENPATYYCNIYQNSGVEMNVSFSLRATKIN